MSRHVSVTGTQAGLTAMQIYQATYHLNWLLEVHGFGLFHHGDCIGADEQFAAIASGLGYFVIAHPCDIESKRAWFPSDEVLPVKRPMDRNTDMVTVAEYILAGPETAEEVLRSGTWATIRRARRSPRGTLVIINPDGSLAA